MILDTLVEVVSTPSGPVSTIDRVDYTNDTATATAVGPLSAMQVWWWNNRQFFLWLFWWWKTPGSISTVDRIDYSNDTATASPKGLLSLAEVV